MSEAEASRFVRTFQPDSATERELEKLKDDPAALHRRVVEMGFDATPDEIADALIEYLDSRLTGSQIAEYAGGLSEQEIADLHAELRALNLQAMQWNLSFSPSTALVSAAA